MGFWSSLKKAVSGAYKKADAALGGFLPGAQTPAEVARSKAAASKKKTTPKKATPADVLKAGTKSATKSPSESLKFGEKAGPTISKSKSSSSRSSRRSSPVSGTFATQGATPGETQQFNEPTSGWENVKATIKAVKNPFDDNNAYLNLGFQNNIMIQEGIEAAVNNPYVTALVLAGLTGPIKGLFTKRGVQIGRATSLDALSNNVRSTAGRIASNTKNAKLTSSLLVKAGFSVAAIMVIKEAIGTYPFAKFEIAEAMQTIGLARWKAFEEGRFDLVEGLDQLQNEILNPQGWDYVLSKLPWTNVHLAAAQNIETAEASRVVFDTIIKDAQEQQATGTTDDERWKLIREREDAQDKAAVDYYNDQRKQMLIWEREAMKVARNEDAAFWAKEAAKQRELEAEDRKAIADFWIHYRKMIQKISEDNRPSNLNFGLL